METFMVLFFVVATIVTSSKFSTAFSIEREGMNLQNLPSTTYSYSDWSTGTSSEDDVKKRFVRDVTAAICEEPSEEDLMEQLRSGNIDGNTNRIPEDQEVPRWEQITGMGAYVENGHQQLLPPSELLGVAQNRRTLCPWTEVSHTQQDRYPRTIFHARCLCSDCTDWSQSDHMSNISTCKPITKQIIVLRRGECINGTYSYNLAREPVIVACVCSRSSNQ